MEDNQTFGRWTANEIIEHHREDLLKWRVVEKLGRVKCAARLVELTGRDCSPGAMEVAFKKLGFTNGEMGRKNVPIKDESDLSGEQPIEELIKSRVEACKRKQSKAGKHVRTLELPAEPVGIMVFGDPHVDNDGCDWGTLFEHVSLAQATEGVLASCVGDMQDNWVGRLARCYADSSVTASDGWRLSEWLLDSLQWISIVGGNHDAWANGPGVDPMAWLTKKCGVLCYAPDEIRISLKWKGRPDLDPVVWILRHDFGGRSWFHPTHGPHKEAMLDGKCHILTAGHIHQWGQLSTEQRHDRVTHAVRVRGYKRADAYAKQKGFSEQSFGEACLIVISPETSGPGRITIHWDLEEGCEYLTWLRAKSRAATSFHEQPDKES